MLYFAINLLSSIILTFISCYKASFLKNWYDFYIPILIFIAYLILMIILTFIILFSLAIFIKKDKEFNDKPNKFLTFLMENTFSYLNVLAHVKVKFENKELFPKGKRVLIVCNHKSKFDPMIISSIFKNRQIAWICKKSLFKMPLINRYMYKGNYLSLDREDLRQGLRVIKQSVSYIENDLNSIGVFPEGTRNNEDVPLLDLKHGTFKTAIYAKCDIVIMTMINTEKIHSNFPFKLTKVYGRICKVIKYEDIKDMNSTEISDLVGDIMVKNIVDMKNKGGI